MIPLVRDLVLIILGLLLRAIVAPLVLMATVIASFAAAFGGSGFVFDTILGFKDVDYFSAAAGIPVLVALASTTTSSWSAGAGRRPYVSTPERSCPKPSPPPVASSPRLAWSWRPRSLSSPRFRW
ncbi:MMPL family protein [Micromonospora sp. Llam0]|nr:MMPL family protein [Micromonospora sp. Llam0]